jgi:hypothetical protein
MNLSTDAAERKATPIATGVLDYFPLALAEVARVSRIGNDQHNPGQPLHWAKGKSTDHADSLVRHLLERGTMDVDGGRHTAKVAWRALALLQTELEDELRDTPVVWLEPEQVPCEDWDVVIGTEIVKSPQSWANATSGKLVDMPGRYDWDPNT